MKASGVANAANGEQAGAGGRAISGSTWRCVGDSTVDPPEFKQLASPQPLPAIAGLNAIDS